MCQISCAFCSEHYYREICSSAEKWNVEDNCSPICDLVNTTCMYILWKGLHNRTVYRCKSVKYQQFTSQNRLFPVI